MSTIIRLAHRAWHHGSGARVRPLRRRQALRHPRRGLLHRLRQTALRLQTRRHRLPALRLPLGGYVKMSGDDSRRSSTVRRPIPATSTPIPAGSAFSSPWPAPSPTSPRPRPHDRRLHAPQRGAGVLRPAPPSPTTSQPNTPAASTGIHSGDPIVHYDTVENPTWDHVAIRSLLNLNQTIPFSFVHDGQRTDTRLFVRSQGRSRRLLPRRARLRSQDAEHPRPGRLA